MGKSQVVAAPSSPVINRHLLVWLAVVLAPKYSGKDTHIVAPQLQGKHRYVRHKEKTN